MMEKCLDGFGLKWLWKRIKSLFGETFIESDDIFNVKTPVNGVVSQEKFDELPKEKQSRGLYIVKTIENKIILNGEEFDLRGPAGPDGNPVGTVISFMGLKAPKDYLICDGSSYKISDYPDLAAFFQEQFGSEIHFGSNGDGTFAVPDMRNLFLRGYRGEAGEQLSGEVGDKQEGTKHPHFYTNATNAGQWVIMSIGNTGNIIPTNADKNDAAIRTGSLPLNSPQSTTMPSYYTSRPVNMAVLYCIKAVKSESEKRDDGEIYSTEETRIGTWIDGKPLYRRVFIGDFKLQLNTWTTIFQTVQNIDIVKYSVYFKTKEGSSIYLREGANGGAGNTFMIAHQYNGSENIFRICPMWETLLNMNVIWVPEYTKTTD